MNNVSIIRLGFFFGIFTLMALYEFFSPRRYLRTNKTKRWLNNLAIILINTVIARIIITIMPVAFAILIQNKDIGLFNQIRLPLWINIISTILLMDLVIYFQHWIFHSVPLFWRLHMMHHTDLDIDVTTGLRFHPLEIILSYLIKLSTILILGTHALGILIFEIILNSLAMFNHSNIFIPVKLDRIIRLFIVTPDMHRVHHSVIVKEMNSNYGFNLSLWDRLFKTYVAQPQAGHNNMNIGLGPYREEEKQGLIWMLILFFIGKEGVRLNKLYKRKIQN